MRINLPTWLTLFRVALLPVMVVVFYLPFRGHNITAAIVFVLAAVTDWLDGYLARRMNLTSAFGAFGGVFIPMAFGQSLKDTGNANTALFVFLVFYVTCAALNWAVYARKGSLLSRSASTLNPAE